ncbi:hypothetical protein NMY22_g6148 [Coprinellus aureogranulatus]|nr:hypothetical protein NMY22_g6148 [Coprinellus aureogranulatus]
MRSCADGYGCWLQLLCLLFLNLFLESFDIVKEGEEFLRSRYEQQDGTAGCRTHIVVGLEAEAEANGLCRFLGPVHAKEGFGLAEVAFGPVAAESNDGPTIAQWRNNLPGPPSASSPNGVMRPGNQRLNSNMSVQSYGSEASFGTGLPSAPKTASTVRPALRSQFSSTRLKSGYDQSQVPMPVSGDYREGRATTPTSNGALPSNPAGNRSRSASQPSAYVPKPMPQAPPPLPHSNSHWSTQPRGIPSGVNGARSNKRGSGSSQSTGDSSDYSPNSSSPITPFGSSESSLGGVAIAGSQYGHPNGTNGYHPPGMGMQDPPVKVKVHFHEDIFVIQVSKMTEYEELVEKVGRKIRLCGPRRMMDRSG